MVFGALMAAFWRRMLTRWTCSTWGCDMQHRYNVVVNAGHQIEGVYRCTRCNRAKTGEPRE